MDTKTLIIGGIAFAVIQFIIQTGIFITFPQMVAYAAPLSTMESNQIEIMKRFDKLEAWIWDVKKQEINKRGNNNEHQ